MRVEIHANDINKKQMTEAADRIRVRLKQKEPCVRVQQQADSGERILGNIV
jgi:hypothetical protein